jgi:hypothetical protein
VVTVIAVGGPRLRTPSPNTMVAVCEAARRRRVLDVLIVGLVIEHVELVRALPAATDRHIIT